ncbi:hypothetical protein D3C80_1803790 [compost metagenome]
MDRVVALREEATGGNKQAARVAFILHMLCQHVITRQQLLLWAQRLIKLQLAAPGINLLAVVAQAVIQQCFTVRPKRFEVAVWHTQFFCQHFQGGGRQALFFQQLQGCI